MRGKKGSKCHHWYFGNMSLYFKKKFPRFQVASSAASTLTHLFKKTFSNERWSFIVSFMFTQYADEFWKKQKQIVLAGRSKQFFFQNRKKIQIVNEWYYLLFFLFFNLWIFQWHQRGTRDLPTHPAQQFDSFIWSLCHSCTIAGSRKKLIIFINACLELVHRHKTRFFYTPTSLAFSETVNNAGSHQLRAYRWYGEELSTPGPISLIRRTAISAYRWHWGSPTL